MRVSELSRRSGVPVATIKYYLREGLMPAGEATGATQATYDDGHVQRLRLIRALAEVGGLSLSAIRGILTAVDEPEAGVHQLLGTATYALGPAVDPPATAHPDWEAARAQVDDLLAGLGWQVTYAAPARDQLARALLELRRLGLPADPAGLMPYAEAAQSVAAHEVRSLRGSGSRAENVRTAVVATVLYEPVLLALRRLAQEHESAQRFRSAGEHERTAPGHRASARDSGT